MPAPSYSGAGARRPIIPPNPAAPEGAAHHAVKTFIVEDNPIILERLMTTLQELTPVQVVGSAADEARAMAWLDDPSHGCELLIVDIFLTSGSGLGVLRRTAGRSEPGRRVVLTNYATPDIREACRALGADRVFDKSSEIEELIAYCERAGLDGGPGPLQPN